MRRTRNVKLTALFVAGLFLLTACGSKDDFSSQEDDSDKAAGENVSDEDSKDAQKDDDKEEDGLLSGLHHVEITIQDKGVISVELDADSAPITVTNFVNLAKSGFYDGLTFHRIMNGFMMQGGDPLGDGTGGSDQNIKGEFAANGVENPLSHTRGAISMARAMQNDSASSQFFIVHQDSTGLDGQYACFGYVTDGMDIVDDICENTTGGDANGIIPVENRPIIESIKVID